MSMRRHSGLLAFALGCGVCTAAAWAASLRGAAASSAPAPDAPAATRTLSEPFTHDSLGVIGDVAADGQGRLFALDVQRKTIVMTPRPGAGPVSVGRAGRGPGELTAPISLAMDPGGRLMVLDPGTMRIEVFRTDDAGTHRTGALPLAFPAEDLVACDGRLFLLGSWNFNLIHEISPADGRIVRSFAPDATAADDLMAGYRSSGYLGCGPGPALTFLPMLRPVLTRFSVATGALIGRVQIPGYEQVRVVHTADGGIMFRAPESGQHHRASSLVTLPDGTQLVQVGTLQEGARTRHEFQEVRSFVVSWDAPSIRSEDPRLPRIVAAAGDSVFVVETEPVPRVTVARIRLGEREEGR
jgi:hypothetical protein